MKMCKRILAATLTAAITLTVLPGCHTSTNAPETNTDWRPNTMPTTVQSNSLFVKKVENMPDDFIVGMDASCVPALEKGGVCYYDHDGSTKDVYEILRNNGITISVSGSGTTPIQPMARDMAAVTAILKMPLPSENAPPNMA
jgi:arabinogalactan endo-1,4-beta-galactosidase